jgi:hypothetical protein
VLFILGQSKEVAVMKRYVIIGFLCASGTFGIAAMFGDNIRAQFTSSDTSSSLATMDSTPEAGMDAAAGTVESAWSAAKGTFSKVAHPVKTAVMHPKAIYQACKDSVVFEKDVRITHDGAGNIVLWPEAGGVDPLPFDSFKRVVIRKDGSTQKPSLEIPDCKKKYDQGRKARLRAERNIRRIEKREAKDKEKDKVRGKRSETRQGA